MAFSDALPQKPSTGRFLEKGKEWLNQVGDLERPVFVVQAFDYRLKSWQLRGGRP